MVKHLSITATAQGMVAFTEQGSQFQAYEKSYQVRSRKQNKAAHRLTQESLHLNPIQRSMYRRLMYGLKEYKPEQIAGMSPASIEQVVRDHTKATKTLQILKVKTYFNKYYAAEMKLLNSLFTEMYKQAGREFTPIGEKVSDNMVRIPENMTLNKLGITTSQVIDQFISVKLLPQDFFQLTPEKLDL